MQVESFFLIQCFELFGIVVVARIHEMCTEHRSDAYIPYAPDGQISNIWSDINFCAQFAMFCQVLFVCFAFPWSCLILLGIFCVHDMSEFVCMCVFVFHVFFGKICCGHAVCAWLPRGFHARSRPFMRAHVDISCARSTFHARARRTHLGRAKNACCPFAQFGFCTQVTRLLSICSS